MVNLQPSQFLGTVHPPIIVGPDGRTPLQPSAMQVASLPTLARQWWQWSQSSTGIAWWPDSVSIDVYDRMLRTDEAVYSGVKFTILAVLSRLGEFTHPNRKIQASFREMIANMRHTFAFGVAEIMTSLWAGFSVTEKLFVAEGKRWDYAGLATVHPRSVTFILETQDVPNKNELRNIYQWYRQSYEVDLPTEKVILYSHDSQFGNVYGNSRLKPAFKNWLIKERLLIAWALTLERYGTPLAIGKVPAQAQKVQVPGGGTMEARDYLLMLLDQLQGKSSLVVSGDWEVQIEQVKRALGGDFEAAIEYFNKAIHLALLTPSLIAGHGGGHGSYALGQKHFDTFEIEIEQLAQDLISILRYQFARPWILLNYGKQKDYGTWELHPLGEEDRKMLSETFLNLVNSGIASPERLDDINAMRKRFDLEEVAQDDVLLGPNAPQLAGQEGKYPDQAPEGGVEPSDSPETSAAATGSTAKTSIRSAGQSPINAHRQKHHNDLRKAILADP